MGMSLTNRQQEVLDFIVKEIQLKGYPPSVREIGFALGMTSSATVHGHLAKLEEKGYIRKDATKSRTIEVLNSGQLTAKTGKSVPIPLVNRFVPGVNVLESIKEYFVLSEQLINANAIEDPLFMVQVKGNHMKPLGILDGDYILARQQQVVLNGELVVTLSTDNGQPCIRRFYITKEGPYLTTEDNQAVNGEVFKDIHIFGKVIGVHRLTPKK